MERMLTTGEVATLLGVTEQTVRGHVRSGRLVAVQIGRVLRFRPSDVEAYLEACTVRPVA